MAQNETETTLKPRQRGAIVALLSEPTITAAAEQANVSRSTLSRWLRDDEAFRSALEEATTQALREFSTALVGLSQKAAQALSDALDPNQDIQHRLRAADIVTGRLLAVRELIDLEARLAALEQAYKEGV